MDIQTNFSKSEWKNRIETGRVLAILLPLLLFFLPFWNANEGVDYADTGYSLNNYANYESLGTTWKLATYLANAFGRFLMQLPGGDTMLGMNLYTSLLISGMALAGYFFCKRRAGQTAAFWGEVLAVSLCWCPTVILYNYMTYVFLLAALLCLYHALTMQKLPQNTKKRNAFLAAAGVLLGINVFVRFSNLAETAFILLVWYAAWLLHGKQSGGGKTEQTFFSCAAKDTLWCLAGYLAGFLSVFVVVCANYGLEAYLHMLTGMSSMEGSNERYSIAGMLT